MLQALINLILVIIDSSLFPFLGILATLGYFLFAPSCQEAGKLNQTFDHEHNLRWLISIMFLKTPGLTLHGYLSKILSRSCHGIHFVHRDKIRSWNNVLS